MNQDHPSTSDTTTPPVPSPAQAWRESIEIPADWYDPTFIAPGEEHPPQDTDDTLVVIPEDPPAEPAAPQPGKPPWGRGYVKRAGTPAPAPTPERSTRRVVGDGQVRLKILDTWMRSGLPAGDFAPLVRVSQHTLYAWKKRFEAEGPAGLMDQPRGRKTTGSQLPEITKRAILMMKRMHPDWGVDRMSDLLLRTQALQASPAAIARVLTEDGYLVEESKIQRHPDKIRFFERATPNQLWQTDLFTFMLKRQNQRVFLVCFMDDHSRYIVSYGLHASQSAALVLETLRAGIASYGTPQEVLTDNGSQYVTWRGTSQFQHECRKRGIKQVVSAPRHPETLGKIERFWGTLWKECVQAAVFTDLGDARIRIGHFIDFYNFRRTHTGINGMVPADRFFSATPAMLESLRSRVAANALEIARNGVPKAPLYLAGNVGGTPVVLHGEGDRVILSKDGQRAEVTFEPRAPTPMPSPAAATAAPPAEPPAAPPPAAAVSPPQPEVAPPTAPGVPAPHPSGIPTPMAPAGIVRSDWTGAEPSTAAGASPLDDLVAPGTDGGAP